MVRTYLLYLAILLLAVYAWRDWFVSLCGLIVMTAVAEHTDMPRSLLGIPGMNPWNILMLSVLIPWLIQRYQQRTRWDLPPLAGLVFVTYLLVLFVAYIRTAVDLDSLPPDAGVSRDMAGFTINHLINPVKFIVPGILLYDGCRTRRRMVLALSALVMMAAVHSLVILRSVPLHSLLGSGDFMHYRSVINKRTGLHANDVVAILITAFWGLAAMWRSWEHRALRGASVVALGLIGITIPLCQSRAGLAAFLAVGLTLAVVRWRVLFFLLPPALLAVCLAMPSIPTRLGMGVAAGTVEQYAGHDWDAITAGRTSNIWPAALEQIEAAPLIGQGRRALLRTGAYQEIADAEGACPNHPHNAYLEVLLDAGLLGLTPVLAMITSLLVISALLCRRRYGTLIRCVGVFGISATVTLLVTCASSEGLFPRISMVATWCVWALVLRGWMSRTGRSMFAEGGPQRGLGRVPGAQCWRRRAVGVVAARGGL